MAQETMSQSILTGPPGPSGKGDYVGSLLSRCETMADRPAVISDGRSVTFRELGLRVIAARSALRHRGLKPGRKVGIIVDPGVELIVATLAVLANGCAVVPMSGKESSTQINHCLSDSKCALLIAQPHHMQHVREYAFPTLVSQDLTSHDLPCDTHDAVIDPLGTAFVFYRWEVAGLPIGVPISHGALDHAMMWASRQGGVSANDRLLHIASAGDVQSVFEIGLSLYNGAALHVADKTVHSSPNGLRQFLQDHRLTVVFLPPVLLKTMISDGLPDLRLVVVCGAPVDDRDILNGWITPSRQVVVAYGHPETTMTVAWAVATENMAERPTLGKPIDGHVFAILDRADRTPVPIGSAGEIAIGGPGVVSGYLGRDDATLYRFIPTPGTLAVSCDRLFLTGDLGEITSDGQLIFQGRLDRPEDPLRPAGIDTAEIEGVLRMHPFVEDARVVPAVPDDETELVAHVRCREGIDGLDDYWSFMQQHYPLHRIPRQVDYRVDLSDSGLNADGSGSVAVARIGTHHEAVHVSP